MYTMFIETKKEKVRMMLMRAGLKASKYAMLGVEEKVLTHTEKFLDEVDKIDSRMSMVWNLWKFRMGRIFTPNFVSHMKSIISLCLSVLQILIILQLVHDTGGHFANLPHLRVVLFPLYVQYGLRLIIQFSVFLFVLYRVLYDEKDAGIHLHFNELNRFLPVVEHLLPLFSYIVVLLASIAFGYCHMDGRDGDETICRIFTVKLINTITVLVVIVHCIHYLIVIYHNKRHTALPQKRYATQEYQMEESSTARGGVGVCGKRRQSTTFMSTLENVNEEMALVYNWWKYRMTRLFSSIVAHNVCNIVDTILEGTQLIVLVQAIDRSKGDLGNIDTANLLLPTYIKLFLKAFVHAMVFACVCHRTYMVESKLSFLQFLREPNKHNKPLEHLIPIFSSILLGVVTVAISQCHLGALHTDSKPMCQAFKYELVMAVLVVAALIQFSHHIVSIYHCRRHSSKPARGEKKEELEGMSCLTGMSSVVN
jgi:hypothetical protein